MKNRLEIAESQSKPSFEGSKSKAGISPKGEANGRRADITRRKRGVYEHMYLDLSTHDRQLQYTRKREENFCSRCSELQKLLTMDSENQPGTRIEKTTQIQTVDLRERLRE